MPAAAGASQPPTYPERNAPHSNTRLPPRFTGSFRLAAGTRHLHRDCNFTEPLVETASKSLRHSCRSELTRQGISLRPVTNQASFDPVLTGTAFRRVGHFCRPLHVAM